MTDAAPTPIPPMTRQRIRVTGPPARPVPIALATNSRPAPTITLMRPYRFASCPAAQAPRAAPSSADATEKPVSPDPIAKSLRNAVTAPLMTAVSNPNMNPPRAATDARWTARVVLNRSSAAGTDGITAPLGESRRSPDAARAVSQASGMPRANMWARQLPPAGRRNSTVRREVHSTARPFSSSRPRAGPLEVPQWEPRRGDDRGVTEALFVVEPARLGRWSRLRTLLVGVGGGSR